MKKEYYLKNKKHCLEYSRNYYFQNKNKVRQTHHNYYLKNKLKMKLTKITSGKTSIRGVIKRLLPDDNCCELCKRQKRLDYHHWDNNDLQKGKFIKGIWICRRCHLFIGLMERETRLPNLFKKYLKLKQKINNETRNNQKIDFGFSQRQL